METPQGEVVLHCEWLNKGADTLENVGAPVVRTCEASGDTRRAVHPRPVCISEFGGSKLSVSLVLWFSGSQCQNQRIKSINNDFTMRIRINVRRRRA